MPDFLTTSEKFADRVELLGYLTLAISAILTVVYFGMIFFYAPVTQQSAAEKAAWLLFFPAVSALAWWLPRHKNFSRILFSCFFFLLGTYAGVRLFAGGHAGHAVILVYAFFGYWILNHPAGIACFRTLKPFEARAQEGSQLFFLLRTFFLFQAAYNLVAGCQLFLIESGDPLYNPNRAAGMLLWALLLGLALIALRRGLAWFRWLMVVTLGLATLAQVPATLGKHTYLDYWSALGGFFITLAFCLYLAFSPFAKTFFKRPPAA